MSEVAWPERAIVMAWINRHGIKVPNADLQKFITAVSKPRMDAESRHATLARAILTAVHQHGPRWDD